MVMQTKGTPRIEVDESIVLPFQLIVSVGCGVNKQKIIIDTMTMNPKNIHNFVYEIEELKELSIHLIGDASKQVNVVWGNMQEDDLEDPTFGFTLNQDKTKQNLFSINDEEQYPWRCGTYHFEVIYEEKKYLAGFKIVPKNVNSAQFSRIYALINEELEGLAIDYVRKKKTFGELIDLEESSHWRFVNWYINTETKLFNALTSIENDSHGQLKKDYKIENEPKHIDSFSVRWENSIKGQVFKGSKYLNKKLVQDWDTDLNRLVKNRTIQLLNKLVEVCEFLLGINVEYEQYANSLRKEVDTLRVKRTNVNNSRLVAQREKKRISETLSLKEMELKNITNQLSRSRNITNKFLNCKKNLSARINSEFWYKISNKLPRRITMGRHIGYQIFQKIWKESRSMISDEGLKPIDLPVYKSTSELYEYYVLFIIINVFKDLMFTPREDSIAEQLKRTFFEDGLKDGSKVSLYKDKMRIDITYDEMIAHNADSALDSNTNYYSGGRNRKPDIRIDYFNNYQEKWNFQSSFIVEVKYSPFYNIHNKQGKTRAMEQMSEYWRIMYVFEKNGRKKFRRQVVHDVVCIYPGTVNKPIRFSDDFGTFLQLFPNEDKDDIYDIVGKNELKSMFSDWLDLD
ncbi:DUF2357 domain-containing protein [Virgibacillus senegalensis]|uniref:DUF2357 domain-containing protein n=1 Tax=Virgibacillus senegalensis TaxID=1499679 RepID=UPI00069E01B1|nr:DUF2357 domain-containing protein [Virgibacillus senegalensis]